MNSEERGQGALHLVKLCVGIERPEELMEWQARRALQGQPKYWHATRMWPRREAELLTGGSLYWVMKGAIACRQQIAGMEELIGEDGVRRCKILLDSEIVLTARAPRRAFQGWRYLSNDDAPRDLTQSLSDEDLPNDLLSTLDSLGVR